MSSIDTAHWVEKVNQTLEQLDERFKRIEDKLDVLLLRFEVPRSAPLEDNIVNTATTTKDLTDSNDTTPQGPYVYEALDPDKSEIRLLALHSAEDEADPVVCELQTVELDSEPAPITARSIDRFKSLDSGKLVDSSGLKYNALSYTWSSPDDAGPVVFSDHVFLNGHVFSVTRNLEVALRHFRQIAANTVPQTKWWIDAICINQDDVLERNAQVLLMRRIYRRASHVSIWLGEEADDSSLALDTIVKLSHPPKRGPGEVPSQTPIVSADEKFRRWKALWAFYQRPWFERAWVRQEVALSIQCTVYCGACSCDFNSLKTATLYLDHVYSQIMYRPLLPVHSTLTEPPYARLNSIVDLIGKTSSGSRYAELADLLTQTRNCQATDLRDKIFSLLGMADPEKYWLQPDYRTPLTEVFISTTRCVIEASKRVDILCCCQSSKPGELPSWVPEYDKPWERTPFRGSRNANELNADFVFEGNTLRIKGDFIEQISEISEDYVCADDNEDQLDNLIVRWKGFIRNREKFPENHSVIEDSTLNDLSMERSVDKWLKFFSIRDIRFLTWNPKYSPDGKVIFDPMFRLKLRPPRAYDPKNLKSLLIANDFDDERKPLASFYNYLREYGVKRRLCLLKSGVIGLVPATAKVGDTLAILHGSHFPFVLREAGDMHSLVGEAWLPNCLTFLHEKFVKNRRWYSIV